MWVKSKGYPHCSRGVDLENTEMAPAIGNLIHQSTYYLGDIARELWLLYLY